MNSGRYVKVFAAMAVMVVATGVRSAAAESDDLSPAEVEDVKKFLAAAEKMDIEQILSNNRLMSNNVKCFLDEGPCPPQFKDAKRLIPLLVKDTCKSCTSSQKKMVKKTIDAMRAQRPDDLEKLKKFFDPKDKYMQIFFDSIKE